MGDRPDPDKLMEGLTDAALDRAKAFYDLHASIPGALAAAGCAARISSAAGNGARTGWISV